MATTYSVSLSIKDSQIKYLLQNGFHLYAFKAVATNAKGGLPVVWWSTNFYGQSDTITWQEQYGVYNSNKEVINGTTITSTNQHTADLGQIAVVQADDALFKVRSSDAAKGTILIQNDFSVIPQLTVGVTQTIEGGGASKLCAFPLMYGYGVTMTPVEKIILIFANAKVNTGTVIEQAFSHGVMIDMTGATGPVTVLYDDKLWANNTDSIFTQIPPETALAQHLIIS